MMWYLFLPLIISSIFFIFVLIHDPRSLLSGFSFLLFLFSILLTIGFVYLMYADIINEQYVWITYVLFVIGIIVIGILSVFPFLFVCLYFINGIRVLKKEGLRFSNALSLLFALCFIGYMLVYPNISELHSSIWTIMIFNIITLCIIYLLFIFSMFSFSGLLNLMHINKKRRIDYIVVLGCGIFGDKMTPLLKGRVDKGIELYKKHPEATIIMSGGQGKGENIPESVAMKRYALEKGIQEDKIIIEDQSMDTRENLINSYQIINDSKANIVIVTNRFHVLRALMIARKLKIKCKGYGSKTKWYFSLNAHLREFVGYLSISKYKHIFVLVIITLIELYGVIIRLKG